MVPDRKTLETPDLIINKREFHLYNIQNVTFTSSAVTKVINIICLDSITLMSKLIFINLLSVNLGHYSLLAAVNVNTFSHFQATRARTKLIGWQDLFIHNPCGFGVSIVPLYPPACRKRQLKGGGVR